MSNPASGCLRMMMHPAEYRDQSAFLELNQRAGIELPREPSPSRQPYGYPMNLGLGTFPLLGQRVGNTVPSLQYSKLRVGSSQKGLFPPEMSCSWVVRLPTHSLGWQVERRPLQQLTPYPTWHAKSYEISSIVEYSKASRMALSPWQLCFHADLKCRVRNCSNKRYIDSMGSSPYYACAHTHCKESRSSKSSSPYCGKHACKVKNCDMPRQSPGLYCKKHTCHGKGCVNCVDPPSSEGKQEPSYCHGHQVCQVDGCDALVFLDPSNRAALFCFRHYCAASNGCAGQRVDGEGAQACRDHTCALHPTCPNPRADPIRGLFCEAHECADANCRKQIYDSGGIASPASEPGKWCADHMCMAALLRREDCANRREGTAANETHCADHELCEVPECNAFRAVRGRGVRLTRCEEHLKTKCAFPLCAQDAEPPAAACRYHVCRSHGCLATLSPSTSPACVTPASLYCDIHRCAEITCVHPRTGDSMYCPEHAWRGRMGNGTGVGAFPYHRHRRRHRGCPHDRKTCHCFGVVEDATRGDGGGGGGGGVGRGCCCGCHDGGDDESSGSSSGSDDDAAIDHTDGCDGGVGCGHDCIGVGGGVGACFRCGGAGKNGCHRSARC
ncbi:hypothetical protein GGS26DRAFT_598240 [Hypomontagnella submonticulosa]|nr:hypothetical protein GGS26DRAFT_598240 [Hypomontagnella submonticulosa]